MSEPRRHVFARLFVSLVLQQLLMSVGRHFRGMVPSGKFLIVMVDAEFGVELQEVQALLLAASILSRQVAPQGLPVAVETHEMRLVRHRPVSVVPVFHVLIELAHRASELLLQAHNKTQRT